MAVGAVRAGLGRRAVTLVWVLFPDAARIHVLDLRQDFGPCVRLLERAVYRKLGAAGRREAVRRARALDLL